MLDGEGSSANGPIATVNKAWVNFLHKPQGCGVLAVKPVCCVKSSNLRAAKETILDLSVMLLSLNCESLYHFGIKRQSKMIFKMHTKKKQVTQRIS